MTANKKSLSVREHQKGSVEKSSISSIPQTAKTIPFGTTRDLRCYLRAMLILVNAGVIAQ